MTVLIDEGHHSSQVRVFKLQLSERWIRRYAEEQENEDSFENVSWAEKSFHSYQFTNIYSQSFWLKNGSVGFRPESGIAHGVLSFDFWKQVEEMKYKLTANIARAFHQL